MLAMKRISKNIRIFFAALASLVLFFILSSYGMIFNNIENQNQTTIGFDHHHHHHHHHYHRHVRESYVIRPSAASQLRSILGDGAKKSNPFVAPFNVSRPERIAWLLRALPGLEIFSPADRFESRVARFFDAGCEARVFMTWISPAARFGPRELLAAESLFKAHPKACLMILSRTMDSVEGDRVLKPLVDRGFKACAVSPDLNRLVSGTPAEAWLDDLKRGDKDPGEISLAQNLSNLMRLVVLYKYGGVYLDTDFIVTRPLTGLRNSIGAQSVNTVSKNWTRLNNAVLIFDVNHPLLLNFIEEFASTFDGNRWGHNGPYLVTRVVRRVGPPRAGFNFTVLPPMAFYPVDWTKIGGLFLRPKSEAQSKWVKAKVRQLSGESYGVHLWNRQSNRLVIEEGSVMGKLISGNCIICKGIYSS